MFIGYCVNDAIMHERALLEGCKVALFLNDVGSCVGTRYHVLTLWSSKQGQTTSTEH